jgi:RHS repeat-associated protein
LIGEEKEGEYRSYHFDFRGSTVALTDKTGKVVQRFQYGPYGDLVKGDSAVTPFLFNGKFGVMTEGNGLYYMRARFYSAQIKRFVNQDLLKGFVASGQSLNRFMFVQGDPVKYTDPFGLDRRCGPGYRAVADPTQPHVSFCVKDGSDPHAKLCVTEECLLRGTNDNSYEGPRPFGGVGGYASIHMFAVGLSTTISYTTDLGKQCSFVTVCGRLGPGLYLGAGMNFPYGLSRSDIENSLSGCSVGAGADLAFGESIGVMGSVGLSEDGITSIGTVKGSGRIGQGVGFSTGLDACNTWVISCF